MTIIYNKRTHTDELCIQIPDNLSVQISDQSTVSRRQRRIAMSNVARFRRQIQGVDFKSDLIKNDPWAMALRDFMVGIDNLTDENEIARRYSAFLQQLVELRKGGGAR
jgi:hypothetical protein